MTSPHNPNNITMPPTSEDTVILGERGREIPDDLQERIDEVCDLVRTAILAERERCLRVAKAMRDKHSSPTGDQYTCGAWDMAVRIVGKISHPTLSDEAKLRRSKALDELGALDGELL